MVGIFLSTVQTIPHRHLSLSLPLQYKATYYSYSYFSFPQLSFLSFPSLSLSLSLSETHTHKISLPLSGICNNNNTTMNNISMGFSCGDDFEGEESEVALLDETREKQQHSSWGCGMEAPHNHVQLEVDFQFWPVEHPLEPPDEDRPVKCPMPDSSVINDGGRQEKRSSESSAMRKRTEVSSAAAATYSKPRMDQMVVAVAEPPPAVRAVRKRHHNTLTRGDHMISPLRRMPPIPSLPTQSITIFQMLQQLDKFES